MEKNQKGSALLWAIVVIGILSILIAACLTISYSYYNRALQTNSKRQAYLTAKGAVEEIAKNIEDGNEDYISLFSKSTTEYKPLVDEEEKIPLIVTIPSSSNIGKVKECYIKINRIDKTMNGFITVGVIASYSDQTYEVKADLKLGVIGGKNKWQVIRYYQIDNAKKTINNISIAIDSYRDFTYYLEYYKMKFGEVTSNQMEYAMKALLEYMKQDSTWENVESTIKTSLENINRFDDFTMRQYFASRNENHQFPEFNLDEVRDKDKILVPKVVDGKIEKVEVSLVKKNFYTKKYYIQPKYSNKYNYFTFIFAYGNSKPNNGGTINLVYHKNHWYYIEDVRLSDTAEVKPLGPTSFDYDDA
ncbi:MAG: hypothetical protein RR623_08470, partial [Bacilli bacterium]